MSKPRGKNWEIAQLTRDLMNENKKKKKKEANQWRCKYYYATAETQQYSQLLQPDKHFIQVTHHCYFAHHAKSMPLFVSYGFHDKSYCGS